MIIEKIKKIVTQWVGRVLLSSSGRTASVHLTPCTLVHWTGGQVLDWCPVYRCSVYRCSGVLMGSSVHMSSG